MEELHFAGSPLDQYLQEVGCDLGCTMEAPKAKMTDDSLVEEKGKVEERRLGGEDSIAQEIAKLCESCCLLSPNAIAASGLSKGDSRFAWPWLNLTMGLTGFACLALWRRRSPGGGLLSRWAQGSLFAVSSWQCFKVLTRAIVKWEAKRACNALLWLFGEADAAVQLLRSWEIEAEVAEGGLRLSSIAADFYSTAETQARQLCADFSGSVGALPPPGAHPGAARLRLAFARAWELQEVLLLVALRSCSEGRLRDAWIELRSVRCIAQDGARSLRRQLAYAQSCKATLGKQGTGEVVGAPGAGLGAGVSLSLALATFSQAMKRRKEVLRGLQG